MKHLKRSTTVTPVLLLAFTMLLTACGSILSSVTPTPTPTSTSTPTPTASVSTKGEFVGNVGPLASIGFSTDGQRVIAYLCDGTDKHLSLAEWLKGSISNKGIDITNAHGVHLAATMSAQGIRGTITLKNGQSSPFMARLIPNPSGQFGLFRSEQTFHGVRYLGGWIIKPEGFASTPQGGETFLAGELIPFPVCCNPEGGIINEQTGTLIVSPIPDSVVSVTVPELGTFQLTSCRQGQC